MSKIIWDKTGERLYETGCDHGVLYPMQPGGVYNKGVAWNGLTAVTESPSGAEASPIYADNIKYVNLVSNEELDASVVTNSANAAKALVELSNNLPNSGGIVSWFTGDNDIASFGEQLVSFGQSFAAYYNSVSGVDVTPTSGNNYNFTQNNYSPKALSRIDIYRQTKNQFSALKGLVET